MGAAATEQELRQRHAEIQQRVQQERASAAAEATATTELQQATHTARCTECGSSWTYPVVVLGPDRTVPARRDVGVCPACTERMDAEKEAAEALEEREREQRAAAAREERILELIAQAGGNPWEHGHCTFENFDASEAGPKPVEAARRFVEEAAAAGAYEPVRGLYLWGGTGTGKSHLAVAAFAALLRKPGIQPGDVIFDHALDLITRIQDTYSTGASTLDLIDRRIDAKVWILDDLGSEQASPDVVRRLTLILTRRALRPTLITGNFDPDDYESRHEELYRVGSRLGPKYFRSIEVKGRDRRFD